MRAVESGWSGTLNHTGLALFHLMIVHSTPSASFILPALLQFPTPFCLPLSCPVQRFTTFPSPSNLQHLLSQHHSPLLSLLAQMVVQPAPCVTETTEAMPEAPQFPYCVSIHLPQSLNSVFLPIAINELSELPIYISHVLLLFRDNKKLPLKVSGLKQ